MRKHDLYGYRNMGAEAQFYVQLAQDLEIMCLELQRINDEDLDDEGNFLYEDGEAILRELTLEIATATTVLFTHRPKIREIIQASLLNP